MDGLVLLVATFLMGATIILAITVIRLRRAKRDAPAPDLAEPPAEGDILWTAANGPQGPRHEVAEVRSPYLQRYLQRAKEKVWDLASNVEKVRLAILAAALLAMAQFFTTAKGLSNFIPWLSVAIMAAIGVQVILYLSAWLVAERSAHKAYLRRKKQVAGVDSEEFKRAKSAFRAAGAWAPIMFATGFFVSVFFSNDALFDFVYVQAQQDLNNLKVARSTIGAMFGTIEDKIREDRNAELKELRDSKAWTTWQTGLSTILTTAENSREILQASWSSQRAKYEVELANLRKQKDDKAGEVARLRGVATGDASGVAAATPAAGEAERIAGLQKRVSELQDTVTKLDQQRGDIKVERDKEDKAGGEENGKRRLPGQGPVWRGWDLKLTEVQTALTARQTELAALRRELAAALKEQETRTATTAQELDKARASKEIAKSTFETASREFEELKHSVAEAEGRFNLFLGGAGGVTSVTSGASDMVLNVRRALTVFTGTGSRESFKAIFDGCSALSEMLEREPQTKKLLGGASCDTSSFASRIERLGAFDDAIDKYRKTCVVDDAFNAMPMVADMVNRGRTCAGISTLPFNRIKDERNEIDRIQQENSPTTSHFERTISTLRRGDLLAWLALAIAFSIDFLVLIAAMIGARAIISPLVRDGHVASQADIDDLSISQNIDLKIYPRDPPLIRNQKALLSVVRDDWEAVGDADAGSVVDLQHVPAEFASGLSALLQTYTAKRLAQPYRRRRGVYRVESSLIMQMTRNVGLYERTNGAHRTDDEKEGGYHVKRPSDPRAGVWFDDFGESDPATGFRPGGTAARTGSRAGNSRTSTAPGNDQPAAGEHEQDRGGWSSFRDTGADTKKFFN
jgi:hypothetical protein